MDRKVTLGGVGRRGSLIGAGPVTEQIEFPTVFLLFNPALIRLPRSQARPLSSFGPFGPASKPRRRRRLDHLTGGRRFKIIASAWPARITGGTAQV
jgi:hypothetical protein